MLTRTSLGFSPVMFLFYTGVVALVLHGVPTTSTDLMEEGSLQTTPSSILPPSLLRPLPRLVPRDSPVRAPHCSTPRRTSPDPRCATRIHRPRPRRRPSAFCRRYLSTSRPTPRSGRRRRRNTTRARHRRRWGVRWCRWCDDGGV